MRFLKIKDIFHKASNLVIKSALEENTHTIIIGQNKEWKQQVNIGKQNNQTFVHIPHRLFIEMVKYKGEQHGITVIVAEESYTSKASFIDGDDIPTYGENNEKKEFSGKRIKRGIYRSKEGFWVNADVNGAANILRKTVLKLKNNDFLNIETVHVWNPQSIII